MKKYLGILVICLVLITGCGKKETSVDVFKKLFENNKDVMSITMNAKADIQVEEEGVTVNMPLSLSVKANMENENNYAFELELADNPFIGKLQLYGDVANNEMTMYMPSSFIANTVGMEDTNPCWIVQKQDMSEEETDEEFSIEEIKKGIDDLVDILKEEDFVLVSKDGDISHYQFKISNDLMKRYSEKLKTEVTETLDSPIVLDMYVDTKNNTTKKIEIDMKQFFSLVPDEEEMEMPDLSSIKKFTLTLELSNQNTTVVAIPNDIKENAITAEEYQQLLEQNVEGE